MFKTSLLRLALGRDLIRSEAVPTMTPVLALCILGYAAGAALVIRFSPRRDDMPDFDGGSTHDAAEAALGYLDGKGNALAVLARNSGGAVAWFEESLRRIVPCRGEGRVSAKELRDYLRWARTVQ